MKVITDRVPERRVFRIVGQFANCGFELVDETGASVRTGVSPRDLSDYAFENGADTVRWDFDLVKYEASR